MKKSSIFILFLFLSLQSCHEQDDAFSLGIITGPDDRECVCCGGYFIEIEKKAYRFMEDELPPGFSDFNLIDAKFPIIVILQWELKNNGCIGDEILITKIKTYL